MCLGIPARVVERREDVPDLAIVDILGTKRSINIGLLEEEVNPGDWILIHMGFAMERIDAAKAQLAMSGLEMMGSGAREPKPEEVAQWG